MSIFLGLVFLVLAGLLFIFGPRLFRAETPYAWARRTQRLPPIIFGTLFVFVGIRLLIA